MLLVTLLVLESNAATVAQMCDGWLGLISVPGQHMIGQGRFARQILSTSLALDFLLLPPGSFMDDPDVEQTWSLTQFYSVDFLQSRIGVKKCIFNKHTIEVCISCC